MADPERYIYPAMKTGVIDAKGQVVPESALPDFVRAGMKDAKARMFERRYNLGEAVFHTATGDCSDIFAVCTVRSYSVINDKALVGLIIPLSATSTDAMLPLKQYLKDNSRNAWLSYYSASDQPASLFTGVRHRLMILLAKKGNGLSSLQTTRFLKWFSEERGALFSSKLSYALTVDGLSDPFCKVSSELELNLLSKLLKSRPIANVVSKSGTPIYYHNAPVHWGKVFDFVPHFRVGNAKPVQSSHVKTLLLKEKRSATVILCILNSTLFYWFNWQYSNCRDLSLRDILRFPANAEKVSDADFLSLNDARKALMIDLFAKKKLYSRITNNVRTEFDSFYPAKSKPIIDKIDVALGKHYSLTEKETDFIINYDIKYRTGGTDEEE